MSAHPQPTDDREAFQVLLGLLEDRVGEVPGETLARHVLAVTAGADWPVRRTCAEALIRRWAFARRDELAVAERPRGGGLLGLWRTATPGDARPYSTLLASISPVEGSCDCRDFVRSSLGLCKHLLVALDAVSGKAADARRAAASRQPRGAVRAALAAFREGRIPRELVGDPLRRPLLVAKLETYLEEEERA